MTRKLICPHTGCHVYKRYAKDRRENLELSIIYQTDRGHTCNALIHEFQKGARIDGCSYLELLNNIRQKK